MLGLMCIEAVMLASVLFFVNRVKLIISSKEPNWEIIMVLFSELFKVKVYSYLFIPRYKLFKFLIKLRNFEFSHYFSYQWKGTKC